MHMGILMKSKDEVLPIFTDFCKLVENKFGRKIKVLRSNTGGEYTSKEFRSFMEERGIEFQTSCAYTPEQNGVAEHKNRHLLGVARSLMIEMNVPKAYWSDGVLTAAFLINQMPSKVLGGKSPLQTIVPKVQLFPIPSKVLGCKYFCSHP